MSKSSLLRPAGRLALRDSSFCWVQVDSSIALSYRAARAGAEVLDHRDRKVQLARLGAQGLPGQPEPQVQQVRRALQALKAQRGVMERQEQRAGLVLLV